MLHARFQDHRTSVSEEDDLKVFTTYEGGPRMS